MKKLMIALGVCVVLIGGLYAAFPMLFFVIYSNSVYTTEFRVDGNDLYMTGLINSYTPDQLKDVFAANPDIDRIIMGDMPGSIDDEANLAGAAWVAARGVDTYLTRDSRIASGATDFFLVGQRRIVEEGAEVGVHAWADASGLTARDYPRNDAAHAPYITFYESIGWTRGQAERFYFYTIDKAPADGMHIMTPDEMMLAGLATQIVAQTN